jgi:hypothetical protein
VKTRKDYEEYLNTIYAPEEALELGERMLPKAVGFLMKGLYGSALRRFDEITFNVGFNDFIQQQNLERIK